MLSNVTTHVSNHRSQLPVPPTRPHLSHHLDSDEWIRSADKPFDPRTSIQFTFEFEPFELRPEETVSHLSHIRLYNPFFFGATENNVRGRKRAGELDVRPYPH